MIPRNDDIRGRRRRPQAAAYIPLLHTTSVPSMLHWRVNCKRSNEQLIDEPLDHPFSVGVVMGLSQRFFKTGQNTLPTSRIRGGGRGEHENIE